MTEGIKKSDNKVIGFEAAVNQTWQKQHINARY